MSHLTLSVSQLTRVSVTANETLIDMVRRLCVTHYRDSVSELTRISVLQLTVTVNKTLGVIINKTVSDAIYNLRLSVLQLIILSVRLRRSLGVTVHQDSVSQLRRLSVTQQITTLSAAVNTILGVTVNKTQCHS